MAEVPLWARLSDGPVFPIFFVNEVPLYARITLNPPQRTLLFAFGSWFLDSPDRRTLELIL
jgi:hypothetical protein